MKFQHNITGIFFALTILFLMGSCTKNFEDLNKPPTSITSIDPALVFSRVVKDGTFAEGGELPNNKFGSWIQHWAGGQVVPVSRYIESAEDAIWEQHYSIIRDLHQIDIELKGKEEDPSARTKLAIAKIYEISIWQRLTDLFGDIPFSEVSKGPTDIMVTPKFDTQESIYTQLIADLDQAMAKLNETDASFGTADFFYNGNAKQWRKFANSLKLRLGMRIRYANPTLAKSTVESAMGKPEWLFSSNQDNAKVPTYIDAQPVNMNPMLNQYLRGSADLRYLASALVDKLNELEDPRLSLLAAPTVTSVQEGKPAYVGLGAALNDADLSKVIRNNYSTASLNTWFNQKFEPIPFFAFTFSEVAFFKAEAALLGWGASPIDAEGFFLEGVKAAFDLSPYKISVLPGSYLGSLSFTNLSDTQKLEKIMTQKWIHLFGRNFEAFAEWRRNGYPVLVPGSNMGSTNGVIPRRAIYSVRESQLNGEHYKEAVSRLSNGDSFLSKVWWDKK